MPLMFQPYIKYADFNGRARRSEYWLFGLFIFIVAVVLGAIQLATRGTSAAAIGAIGAIAGLAGFLFILASLIPGLAVKVRRLHDSNRSGWWLLIALVPLIGAIALLIFYVLDGTSGANRFGADPKNRG